MQRRAKRRSIATAQQGDTHSSSRLDIDDGQGLARTDAVLVAPAQ
jgi:hypothetical protein